MPKTYGLTAVGNALVDVLSFTTEEFVAEQAALGMKKGDMNLIDLSRAQDLYDMIGQTEEMSGGSAANSLSGFVSFGGRGAFMGKVADDQFGDIFRHDLRSQGTHFSTPSYKGEEETGRSYVLVTPDSERTMNTYLGVNAHFGPDDIDERLIADSKILLLEGYLYDKPEAKKAFQKAAEAAKASGTKVAFTLSSESCVERHFKDFHSLVYGHVDILFANEKEIKAFTLKDNFEEAAEAIRPYCDVAVVTRGSKGALILTGGETHEIASVKPEELVDTTGAGDAFASGVLYGLSEGMSAPESGRLGAEAASKTISHMGARSLDVKFSQFLMK